LKLREFALLLIFGAVVFAQSKPGVSEEVIAAIRAGRIADARTQLEAALKQSPADTRLWTLQGLLLSKSGDADAALKSYHRALQLKPDYLPALEGAAEIQFARRSPMAASLLERAAKVNPNDKTVQGMLGELAAGRGDCAAAVNHFAQSRSLIDNQAPALFSYGSCLVRLRRAEEAIPVFHRIVEIKSGDSKVLYDLAAVQSLSGRHQDVLATLGPLLTRSTASAGMLALAAESYEALSDTPHAVAALREAIVRSPDTASYYVAFANLCLAHASFQVGIDMVDAGLGRLRDNASLYLARGVLQVQLGKYEDAERDFATARRLDPKIDFGGAAAALAQLQQSNFAEAERKLRNHLSVNPKDSFAWYLLAETLSRAGAVAGTKEFEESLSAAGKSVELQPDFSLGRDILGRLYLQMGRIDEAVEQSRLAFRADPSDQTALYHLIVALRKAERADEVPPLVKKLQQLKEQAQLKEATERKYRLFEPNSADAAATDSSAQPR
jgi:tetratricopeptide (TPR) repeat protein